MNFPLFGLLLALTVVATVIGAPHFGFSPFHDHHHHFFGPSGFGGGFHHHHDFFPHHHHHGFWKV